jgi:hypothetical protein
MDKIPFRIIEIVTENFRVLPDNEIEDSVGIEISTGHSFAVNIPEHRVRCYSNYTYKQQDKEILVLDLICTFDVEEESFTSFKKNNKLILEKTTPYSRCVLLFRNNLDSTESIVIKCDHSFSFYDCSGIRFGGGLDYDREYYSILSNINTDILKKTENKRFAIPTNFAAPAPCFKCKHFFNNNTLINVIAYSIVEHKN